jgi:hypothetical protein
MYGLPFAVKMVYASNPVLYMGISIAVFLAIWITFNVLDQLLFFSPIFYFYVPSDAEIGFVLTNLTAGLLGLIVSMNIYVIKNSRFALDKSLVTGSFLGLFFSSCISCSSVGFLIISTFGGAGVVATSFFANYQLPLRLLSICIMAWALYSVCRRITKSCVVNPQQKKWTP